MVEAPKRRGRPTLAPEERRASLHVKIPRDALDKLRRVADERKESQSDIVAKLIRRMR